MIWTTNEFDLYCKDKTPAISFQWPDTYSDSYHIGIWRKTNRIPKLPPPHDFVLKQHEGPIPLTDCNRVRCQPCLSSCRDLLISGYSQVCLLHIMARCHVCPFFPEWHSSSGVVLAAALTKRGWSQAIVGLLSAMSTYSALHYAPVIPFKSLRMWMARAASVQPALYKKELHYFPLIQ